jgi:hypothetical protein
MHRTAVSQPTEVAQARVCAQAFGAVRQDWHAAAVLGGKGRPAKPPHVRSHADSHWLAMQTLNALTSAPVAGWSMMHCDQQAGSPLHGPKHSWYAAHDGSPAQAFDSAQQFEWTHAAHAGVPYGKPQSSVVSFTALRP